MDDKYDPTTEEYIEIIYELQQQNQTARVKDIAQKRGVTRSSVSTALTLLKKKKLIVHENYGRVELTHQGLQLGKTLERRHWIIKQFFTRILGIDIDLAETDACKIEHYLSTETIKSFVNFINFIDGCPTGNPKWLEKFKQCSIFGNGREYCPACNQKKDE